MSKIVTFFLSLALAGACSAEVPAPQGKKPDYLGKSLGDWVALALFENYLIFGSDGDSLLSYNIGSDSYEVITVFMMLLNKFNAFEEMVYHILKKRK